MSLFLIDIGKPVLFVHIPKCGGSSIREGKEVSNGYRVYDPDPKWDEDLPSFGFVRNPLQRVISCWKDWRYSRCLIDFDFDDFVNAYVGSPEGIDDPTTVQHHLAPMVHPMHGLQYAKYIGRFESLQQDYDRFCYNNAIASRVLPHLRRGFGEPQVSETSRARIELIYRDDHTRFYPC